MMQGSGVVEGRARELAIGVDHDIGYADRTGSVRLILQQASYAERSHGRIPYAEPQGTGLCRPGA